MTKKAFFPILIMTAGLLLIPLIAMKFTPEVNWGVGDFVIAGLLLLGTGVVIQYLRQRITNPKTRIVLIILVIAAFVLIWAELAVGIFGSPLAGN